MRHVEHFTNLVDAVAYAISVNGLIQQPEIGHFIVISYDYNNRTLSELREAHADLDEATNELLMFVYHLETIERRYEQSHPLSYAIGRDGIVR